MTRSSLVVRPVTDLGAARAFYVESLGWAPVAELDERLLVVRATPTQLLVVVVEPLHAQLTALLPSRRAADTSDIERITRALQPPAAAPADTAQHLPRRRPVRTRRLVAVGLALAVLAALPVQALLRATPRKQAHPAPSPVSAVASAAPTTARPAATQAAGPRGRATLPGGRTQVLGPGRLLVAYYGTPGSAALGLLGSDSPERVATRLRATAREYAALGHDVQPMMDLVVTIAHRRPGPAGTYNSSVTRTEVEAFLRVARRHGLLLLLNLQPGRESFLDVARRWEWALRDAHVGLALDPEWRMGRSEVPGRTVGRVRAAEVNAVVRWLGDLTRRHDLPQKLVVVHQFRRDMVTDLVDVRPSDHVLVLQDIDGVGSPQAKLATFQRLVQPGRFPLGFKLFTDRDTRLMSPREVSRIRPRVSLVTYQ